MPITDIGYREKKPKKMRENNQILASHDYLIRSNMTVEDEYASRAMALPPPSYKLCTDRLTYGCHPPPIVAKAGRSGMAEASDILSVNWL